MKQVLYDTNVILDVLLNRAPHVGDSARALDAAGTGRVQGFMAAHAVTTVFYVLERDLGSARAKVVLSQLLTRLQVAPVTDAGVRAALAGPLRDFEDGVTLEAAQKVGADVIVTRNGKDFAGGGLPAVHPGVLVV
ncbi:MAG: PIN domain-containing protein [Myxococcota bacterium]|jgi:predicted nucleic acid-binding protein